MALTSNPLRITKGEQTRKSTLQFATSIAAVIPMQANEKWFQDSAARSIHAEQLTQAERFNGRAAMLGFVIGVLTEALTGQGIIHQIGLGPLVDGYAACSAKMLPFCF